MFTKASNSPIELCLIMPRGFWLTFMLVLTLSDWQPWCSFWIFCPSWRGKMYMKRRPWTWLNWTSGSPWWGKRAKVRRKITLGSNRQNKLLSGPTRRHCRQRSAPVALTHHLKCLTALSNAKMYPSIEKSIKVLKTQLPKDRRY